MSTMCVLAITLKHGELYPVLAAGVPLYRISLPLIIGVLGVNALLIVNQEWIIPKVAPYLQASRGDMGAKGQKVETAFDTQWRIYISGHELFPPTRTVTRARFLVPRPLAARGG
jgi:lipopolysaccharide export system permease protein